MNPTEIAKRELLGGLPKEWPRDLLPEIQDQVRSVGQKVVVLDDDPTGTQTVHGIPVLTHWSVDALETELNTLHPGFYILTNSRSMTAREACHLNYEIGANLKAASQKTGMDIEFISRSDSTLRGHFPDEVDALSQALGAENRPCLLAPCFIEGGRYTVNDIHYVDENGAMIPAAETAYARDQVFGYRHSDLKNWVEEKTRKRISRHQVASLSLEDIRRGGPDKIRKILRELNTGAACVVNAASYRDLEVVILGLLEAENQGCRFLFRTAASFVRVRFGIEPRPLLESRDFVTDNGCGGLFVVGSYVPKTTLQVKALMNEGKVEAVEIDVTRLLDVGQQVEEIEQAVNAMNKSIGGGQDTVVYTSRNLVSGLGSAHSLKIGQKISDSLVRVIAALEHQPRYLVAKGGITSSDVATAGLGVRRAMIVGQILPGVPVWKLGDEARYPGMVYIIFPGNVGGKKALVQIEECLKA
jgi:uncharacterized protein YgbK (DUF1537 family)